MLTQLARWADIQVTRTAAPDPAEGDMKTRFDLIFPAVLALMASPLMSAVITAANRGLDQGFLGAWAKALAAALPTALFVVYVVSPVAHRVASRLAGDHSRGGR